MSSHYSVKLPLAGGGEGDLGTLRRWCQGRVLARPNESITASATAPAINPQKRQWVCSQNRQRS